MQVLKEFRNGKERLWKFPASSPLCGGDGTIERISGEAAHRCVVRNSYAQMERKLAHFTSKHALDIDGLGTRTVALLMQHNLVSDFDDFFDLTEDELLSMPGFQEKSARSIIASISNAQKVYLDRLLVGLSIPHVGGETARILAQKFSTLDALQKASEERLAEVVGVGGIVAHSVMCWFSDAENAALVKRLTKHLTIVHVDRLTLAGPFFGERVVVTGTLEHYSREEAQEAIRRAGGTVINTVSSKTTLVVAGSVAGSKLAQARALGIKVLSENLLRARLGL